LFYFIFYLFVIDQHFYASVYLLHLISWSLDRCREAGAGKCN